MGRWSCRAEGWGWGRGMAVIHHSARLMNDSVTLAAVLRFSSISISSNVFAVRTPPPPLPMLLFFTSNKAADFLLGLNWTTQIPTLILVLLTLFKNKKSFWRVGIKQNRPFLFLSDIYLFFLHAVSFAQTLARWEPKCESQCCILGKKRKKKKSQNPALRQCNQPHSEVTFRSRPQSSLQSSHPECTNQHAVFRHRLMGLGQIIARGIRLGNGKGKATNNNKCYLFLTGTLIVPICQI